VINSLRWCSWRWNWMRKGWYEWSFVIGKDHGSQIFCFWSRNRWCKSGIWPFNQKKGVLQRWYKAVSPLLKKLLWNWWWFKCWWNPRGYSTMKNVWHPQKVLTDTSNLQRLIK
jgi:hypothetical protein